MPQNKPSPEPPVMTWGKATPILAVAVVFDTLRIFFEWFWFFGPALIAVGTNVALGGGIIGKILGAGTGGAIGIAGAPAFEVFGVVMSAAVGLLGWMTIGLLLIIGNQRILRENAGNSIWFVAGLMVSEIPFIGTLPAFTASVARMYNTQIKKEDASHKRWEKENAEALLRERNRRAAQLQIQAAQEAQAEQEDEEDEPPYDPTEVARDETFRQTQKENANKDTEHPSNVIPLFPKGPLATARGAIPEAGIPQEYRRAA